MNVSVIFQAFMTICKNANVYLWTKTVVLKARAFVELLMYKSCYVPQHSPNRAKTHELNPGPLPLFLIPLRFTYPLWKHTTLPFTFACARVFHAFYGINLMQKRRIVNFSQLYASHTCTFYGTVRTQCDCLVNL